MWQFGGDSQSSHTYTTNQSIVRHKTESTPDWDRWLDPDAPIDEGLLRGHGDLDRIVTREVSRLVNSISNNGPELIEPAQPEATLF